MKPAELIAQANTPSKPTEDRIALYRQVFEHPKAKKAERIDAGTTGLPLELGATTGPVPDDLVERCIATMALISKKDRQRSWDLSQLFFDRFAAVDQKEAAIAVFLQLVKTFPTKSSIPDQAVYRIPRFLDDVRIQELLCPRTPKWLSRPGITETIVPCRRISSPYSRSMWPTGAQLGGTPSLASADDWPRDPQGRPMHLLAQVPTAHAVGPDWPELGDGAYQFFASQEAVQALRGPCAVRFQPKLTAFELADVRAVEAELREAFGSPAVARPSAYHDHVHTMPMSSFDYRFAERFGGTPKQWAKWDKQLFNLQPMHLVGGYPFFVQRDDQRALLPEPRPDMMLLQLDTDSSYGMRWGDNGIVQFFARRDEVRKGDFSSAVFFGDCA